MMKRFSASDDRRVVMVTGASTGIGLALAKLLYHGTRRVVLTARAESLPRFAAHGISENERLWIRALDVTQSQQANRLVEEVEARWQGVDILVNNAGVCYRAVIEHLTDQDEENQFHINYLGPLHLIRRVLPAMRKRRAGRIINLSSVGGMMAMPTMGGYSASKFALEGASEALWYELKPWGIHVTLIEPGFVHSNSFKNAVFTQYSEQARQDVGNPYHWYYHNLNALIERMMKWSPTTPEDVARIILKVMDRKRPPLRISATWDAVFFSLMRRLVPKGLYHYLLYRGLPRVDDWVPASADENPPVPMAEDQAGESGK